jgi:hypothetical protein
VPPFETPVLENSSQLSPQKKLSKREFGRKGTKAIDVDFLIVRLFEINLWCHISCVARIACHLEASIHICFGRMIFAS